MIKIMNIKNLINLKNYLGWGLPQTA